MTAPVRRLSADDRVVHKATGMHGRVLEVNHSRAFAYVAFVGKRTRVELAHLRVAS